MENTNEFEIARDPNVKTVSFRAEIRGAVRRVELFANGVPCRERFVGGIWIADLPAALVNPGQHILFQLDIIAPNGTDYNVAYTYTENGRPERDPRQPFPKDGTVRAGNISREIYQFTV